MSRSSVPAAPPAASGDGQAASRRPYTPLFRRVAAMNAVVLVGACVVTILVLSPGKLHSFAASEAIVLAGALALVVVINLFLLRRALGPLEALTALARRVDLTRPGQRVPVGPYRSEVPELGGELLEIQETARASLEDVRRISRELRPEALDDLGLTSALVALTERFSQSAGLNVSRNLDRELPPLSEEAELVIYRVAQEALTNVARHAGTDRAELSLTAADGHLTLRVLDSGKGFDPVKAEGGGLRGMRERAVLVGARLAVTRRPRGGTEVRLSVPLDGAAA